MKWYCYRKVEENKIRAVRITVDGEETPEQIKQARELMRQGFELKNVIELGKVTKCKG